MNYTEALRWLYGTQLHGVKLGLENISRLLEALDVSLTAPGAPRYFHVAGTNGKGSVCAMLDAICRADGHRTGLFTSPHLIGFRERIQVDGELISEAAVAEGLTRICELTAGWERSPTFFEIATALALRHFAQAGVEFAVLETGLGGRLDATNVVTPMLSVLTRIDLDHQPFLGETRAAIALEKAGIIKPGIPAISLPQHDEVQAVLSHVAAERESAFHMVLSPMSGVALALPGSHQRWNAALAVHSFDAAGLSIPDEALLRGLQEVRWPGRFQTVGDCILDGAHNPSAALRLARTWREVHGTARATVILGILADKDVPGICAALAPLAARILVVPVRSPRSLPPEQVQAAVWESAPGLDCTVLPDVRTAIRTAATWPEKSLIAGSLFLVGEGLAYLTGQPLEEVSWQYSSAPLALCGRKRIEAPEVAWLRSSVPPLLMRVDPLTSAGKTPLRLA